MAQSEHPQKGVKKIGRAFSLEVLGRASYVRSWKTLEKTRSHVGAWLWLIIIIIDIEIGSALLPSILAATWVS